ncbi:MAG: pitrilysin family protein [Ornithinimicrobium sp.]
MPVDYPISAHTLDNGLRVVISEDHLVPEVSVNVSVGVGSRHELPGRTGLAHLFEHLMFEGSQHVAEGEHFEVLMGHGGRCNATTSFDRTNYFQSVPSGVAELSVWFEADRHTRLLPAVTQANVDNQRDVVVEEKRQRYDNQPYGDALEAICAATFPQGHPYRHTPIGSMDDLQAASLATVRDFYREHYRRDNTVLTMVGDLTVEQGLAWARHHFVRADSSAGEEHAEGSGDAGPAIPPRPDAAPLKALSHPTHREMGSDVPSDRLYACFRLPEVTSPDYLACAMALDLLGGLATSALHRSLVRRDEIAVDCGAAALGLVEGTSLAYVVIDVEETSSIEAADEGLCRELLALATDEVRPELIEAVIAGTERSWLSALASIEERADIIGRSTLTHRDPNYLNTYIDQIRSITGTQISSAAQRYLSPESRAVLAYRRNGAAA